MGKNAEIIRQEKESVKNPEKHYVVEGHTMLPMHWTAISTFLETGNYSEVSKRVNVCRETVRKWRQQEWWKKLINDYLTSKQEEYHVKMSSRVDDIIDGYFEVVTGVNKDTDKTASARINGARLFAEIGDNPLIKKHMWQINHNTQVNNFAINYNRLSELSPEKILEIARTGQIPAEIRQVKKSGGDDGDVIEATVVE
jgi:hypothetical protein